MSPVDASYDLQLNPSGELFCLPRQLLHEDQQGGQGTTFHTYFYCLGNFDSSASSTSQALPPQLIDTDVIFTWYTALCQLPKLPLLSDISFNRYTSDSSTGVGLSSA